MALVEAQEVECKEEMVKEIVEEKFQDEKETKREKETLKTTLKEVRRSTTPTRVMQNVITIINFGIMQVNTGRSKVINQDGMQMWLM